jgi:hypothetical protein
VDVGRVALVGVVDACLGRIVLALELERDRIDGRLF